MADSSRPPAAMRLPQIFAPWVSHRSRTRGEAYFRSGAVRALKAEGGAIEASVRGAELYAVWITAHGTRVLASCSCPYFDDHHEICKHIWAVVLAAHAQGIPILDADVDVARATIEAESPDRDVLLPDLDELDDGDEGPDLAASSSWQARRAAPPRDRLIPVPGPRPAPSPSRPAWQTVLTAVTEGGALNPAGALGLGSGRQLLYVIDAPASAARGLLVVELMTQDRKRNGDWGKPKPARLTADEARAHPDPDERQLLERLLGPRPHSDWSWEGYGSDLARVQVRGVLVAEIVARLCETGRCLVRGRAADNLSTSVSWNPRPWHFALSVVRDDHKRSDTIDGWFVRDTDRVALDKAVLALADGVLVTETEAAPLEVGSAAAWLDALGRSGPIVVPASSRERLLDALLVSPVPVADLPDDLRVEVKPGHPTPRLRLRPLPYRPDQLQAELSFDYDGAIVASDARRPVIRAEGAPYATHRDMAAERRALERLHALGFRVSAGSASHTLQLSATRLPRVVRELVDERWHVEASGQVYRRPRATTLAVRSGIDWFELHGHVDYGEEQAALPALLAALDRGERFVTLSDGTLGIVPEDWLRRNAALAHLGSDAGDHLRFDTTQASLLDALLAAEPTASWDETFARVRHELEAFDGIEPADPPSGFRGTLRHYQREGLGWLLFLQRFGFGGCLADDMGLGKTVMVLALLASRRDAPTDDGRRPSLVVAPRSVVFNWRQEAARFTPGLRVLEYVGSGRAALRARFAEYDIILTTYGTLRRDAAELAKTRFDYVVLDEAQAIKNATSLSAKTTRLLQAHHRLALSGTPIENHLGELWSLFEFLNPGMLSTANAFSRIGGPAQRLDRESLAALSRGLRPFILRRTKQQVASDLPPKTEQTLYCELERPQRVLYDELKGHYRRALLNGHDEGRGPNSLHVLEALLRLRQAACHPGLVDKRRTADPSAKLDLLIPRLIEAIDEGHKALVFSQFTSLLAILRARLDERDVPYEYLDGRTRDREARVARFQNDSACPLFLVSLKAGGVGLNLTAAEYVFLLDPWWNPAVETQAVDRAHRLGQAQHVFAYRLVARDTVEERVLELQQHKRHLADAILTADNSLVRGLSRDDLELLLS